MGAGNFIQIPKAPVHVHDACCNGWRQLSIYNMRALDGLLPAFFQPRRPPLLDSLVFCIAKNAGIDHVVARLLRMASVDARLLSAGGRQRNLKANLVLVPPQRAWH